MGGDDGDEERILVSVRVRPLSEKEISRNEVVDWECVSDTTIVYKYQSSLERSMYPTCYTFGKQCLCDRLKDKVFGWDCSTRQVYEEGARTVVLSAVRGINSSVFAYGQTSSGKTYTMYGITEHTMEDIFDHISKQKEREFQLKFSAMEIYNESVRDLLTKDNTSLKLLDDPERGTVVERLTEETLRDWNHFKELLAVCEAQRQIGETNLNEVSSRSHQILRLTIESSAREYLGKSNSSTLTATLNFVDLAGSERASQALSAGSRLKEGSHINRSLLTLGTVIRKLSKGRTGHIPYRDSKLTRILQSSLGGNARTAVVCTLSPARSYVEQSRNTLLFASCAKEVTTNARVNVVVSDKVLVKHLQKELARLESELKIATPSVRGDATDRLKEKESIIEQLEGHIRELTLQLDLALSKIHDLEQGVEDTRLNTWEEEDQSSYPKLHVRAATSDSSPSNRTTGTDRRSFDNRSTSFQTPHSPDRHSRTSYDEIYSISDFDENLPPTSPFERVFIETPSDASSQVFIHPPPTPMMVDPNYNQNSQSLPYFVEFDPYQVSDEINSCETDKYRVSRGISQVSDEINSCETDKYRVSRGISEESHECDNADSLQTHEAVREQDDDHFEDDDCKEVQCIESESTNDVQPSSPPVELEENSLSLSLTEHENYRFTDEETKEETDVKDLDPSEPSVEQKIGKVRVLEDVNCVECGSGRSSSMGSGCTLVVEKVMCEIIKECGDKGFESGISLEHSEGNLSSLKYDTPENEVSHISEVAKIDEIPMSDIKVFSDIDCARNSVCVMETKEITDSQCMEQLLDRQLEDRVNETSKSIKIMKDVGLNPQHDLDTIAPWPSDYKMIQEKIIHLWHTCSVPLVHRTYFFMLFIKCDPCDAIYMEVERRRLSCIQDAFSNGNPIVLDGQKLTPSSSKKALHSERKMLGKEMKKRYSSDERSDLFVKWGIPLNSKDRCFQLANRLWAHTIDMSHISESANIVAKLVRFSEPQVPKEVFGLNMTSTLARRKSFSLL